MMIRLRSSSRTALRPPPPPLRSALFNPFFKTILKKKPFPVLPAGLSPGGPGRGGTESNCSFFLINNRPFLHALPRRRCFWEDVFGRQLAFPAAAPPPLNLGWGLGAVGELSRPKLPARWGSGSGSSFFRFSRWLLSKPDPPGFFLWAPPPPHGLGNRLISWHNALDT